MHFIFPLKASNVIKLSKIQKYQLNITKHNVILNVHFCHSARSEKSLCPPSVSSVGRLNKSGDASLSFSMTKPPLCKGRGTACGTAAPTFLSL